jgi:hypothetical protein
MSPAMDETLAPAFDALDDGVEALTKLEKTCCVPGRSPRMAELGATISSARSALEAFRDGDSSEPVTDALEDAGGQVGRLQIGCCAENRLPLYARILNDLTTVQLTMDRARGGMDH